MGVYVKWRSRAAVLAVAVLTIAVAGCTTPPTAGTWTNPTATTDGSVTVPGVEGDVAAAVAHPSNGVALVIATNRGAAVALVSSSGVVSGPWTVPGMERPSALAVDGEGRFVVLGETPWDASFLRQPAVARLTAGGAPDAGFGAGGRSVLPAGVFGSHSTGGLALDSSGRVLVTGRILTSDASPSQPIATRLWRLTPDGAVDPSFGQGGSLIASTSALRSDPLPSPDLIHVRGNGSILVASRALGGQMVRQFLPDGQGPDPAFGSNGTAVLTRAGLPGSMFARRLLGGVVSPEGLPDEGSLFLVVGDAWTDGGLPQASNFILRVPEDGVIDFEEAPEVTNTTYDDIGAPILTPNGQVLLGFGVLTANASLDPVFRSGMQAYNRITGLPFLFPQPAGVIEVGGPGGVGLRSGEATVLPPIPVRGVGGAYYLVGRQVRYVVDPDFGMRSEWGAATVAKLKSSAIPVSVFG